MVVVGYILIFVAGLAISEYYNRRIQRIITRQTVRRPAPPRRQASGAVHAGGHGIDAGRIPRGTQNGREHA